MTSQPHTHNDNPTKRGPMAWLLHRVVNPGGIPAHNLLEQAVNEKTILITGASSGIGEATARLLANAGAKVLLVARTEDTLRQCAEQITQAGGKAFYYPTDLSDVLAVERLAETILMEHESIDIFVNNAGKSIRRSIHLSYDRFRDFERTNKINYIGPVRLLLALLPHMRERGAGQVINISTIGVRIPPGARWGAYQASKGAFDTLLRSIDIELRREKIVTTSIYMALVFTRMSAPTPIYRKLPGLYPDEAAGLIARAIVNRPRSISPWWLYPTDVITTLFPRTTTWLNETLYGLTDDSVSAKSTTVVTNTMENKQ